MEMEKRVVKKGTPEFDAASKAFTDLFKKDQSDETIVKGNVGMKSTKSGSLPMPWGCPRLEIYIWGESNKPVSFGWFCGILGCICEPCRSDMEGEYPETCPDEDELSFDDDICEEMLGDDGDDEEDDEPWYM